MLVSSAPVSTQQWADSGEPVIKASVVTLASFILNGQTAKTVTAGLVKTIGIKPSGLVVSGPYWDLVFPEGFLTSLEVVGVYATSVDSQKYHTKKHCKVVWFFVGRLASLKTIECPFFMDNYLRN